MKIKKILWILPLFSTLLIADGLPIVETENKGSKEIQLPELKDKEIKLPEPKDTKSPEDLFEGIDFPEIEPLNGMWKSLFESTNMTGCSAMMQSVLKKFTPPSSEMTLKFSKPFNPNKDLMNGQFKWTKISANRWKGTMYNNGAMPQGMSMEGILFLGVKSEKKMRVRLEQTIVLPKAIAQLIGSSSTCMVVSKAHYLKTK